MSVLTRNNVVTFGSGSRPMIFAHGFGCDQGVWRYITPAFEDTHRIILFDYVGCGGSQKCAYDMKRYATLDGYALDVLEICDALHLEDVIFVGHSVSSMIGMLAAKQRPELFRNMIMLGPSACYVNEPGYEGGFEREELEKLVATIGVGTEWARQLATAALGSPEYPELTNEITSLFCSMSPEVAQGFAKATLLTDNRQALQNHSIQTLVLQVAHDVIAPVSVGEYMSRSMRDCTLVKIDAVGHFPHLAAPKSTIAAMWQHLYQSQPETSMQAEVDYF